MPSLQELKSEFDVQRQSSKQKVFFLLKEKYPDMDESEILKLANMYE
jgi:hypothetical protein